MILHLDLQLVQYHSVMFHPQSITLLEVVLYLRELDILPDHSFFLRLMAYYELYCHLGALFMFCFPAIVSSVTDNWWCFLCVFQARPQPPTSSQIHINDQLYTRWDGLSQESGEWCKCTKFLAITLIINHLRPLKILLLCRQSITFVCNNSLMDDIFAKFQICQIQSSILIFLYSLYCIFERCLKMQSYLVLLFILQLCKKVWLGLYDSRTNTEPDSKDEQKIRDFMSQKYEKKRWYVQPTETMHEEARKQNAPVRQENTSSKPLRTLGNNIPNLLVSKVCMAGWLYLYLRL